MATASELLSFFAPELAAVSAPDKTIALDLAATHSAGVAFGLKQAEAEALYAAHVLTLRAQSTEGTTATGPIVSAKEGDVSVEYGSQDMYADYDLTNYGKRYAALRNKTVAMHVPLVKYVC